jgi:UDP-N-acetylmuramoyl-tripeptide--D-alanyl-D-alanine ligase
MIAMTLGEIATIVGGRLAGGASASARVSAPVEFDSRKIAAGGLFLAFAGEHVDGHDYAATAIASGAVAAIVTRPVDAPSIVVGDAHAALAALAAAVARRLPATTVIAVTGSSGKTSTKDLLAQVLSTVGSTVAPPESFNNELGHPYTVLLASAATRFLVLETSARGLGHIRYLTQIAPPRIGVVLNVGSAHLGEFGSREAIASAKGELVEALPDAAEGGVAILNADDPLVMAMAPRTTARIVTVGESVRAEVRAGEVSVDELGRPRFRLSVGDESVPVRLRLSGEHHVGNALAAAAVGLECGMDLAAVGAALSAAETRSRWRMELTERTDGVLIVNDSYNANPESMRAALKSLAAIARAGDGRRRSWAVLGPMAELGPDAAAEHDAIGRLAVRLDISRLIAVGEVARPIAHGAALEGSWNGEAVWVADTAAAAELLDEQLRPGDVVLVKASRSARLERLALLLAGDAHRAAGRRNRNAANPGMTNPSDLDGGGSRQ